MAITGIPYPSDASAHDRKYTSAQIAAGDAIMQTSGLTPNDGNEGLVSRAAGTMGVKIKPCEAFIAGHKCISDAEETVILDAADATYPRIDVIVFESNSNTAIRNPRFYFVKGIPAASPVAPSISRTDNLFQIPLAQVTIPAGATNLDGASIVDVREWTFGKHLHGADDIDGLTAILATKAAVSHIHSISNITNLQTALNGKAASSHNHSADNITSGTLPITRGGTGATSAAVARGNLGLSNGAVCSLSWNGSTLFITIP